MSDPLKVQMPMNLTSISIHNEPEIQRWTAQFHCTREDLIYAVNKIGTSAFKVQAYLKRQ